MEAGQEDRSVTAGTALLVQQSVFPREQLRDSILRMGTAAVCQRAALEYSRLSSNVTSLSFVGKKKRLTCEC